MTVLILREYLSTLKESGEFDTLMPNLLRRMGIVPLSLPQVGVRQAGVDLAAVGKDESGKKTLWMFVLKRGNVGRHEWNSDPQSIMPSLDEIKHVYIRNNVSLEHRDLPKRIIVATTGTFKQEIEQDRVGYVDTNAQLDRSYEFWDSDRLAALINKYLFDEYALPDPARSQFRRAVALIKEPDYDLEHFDAVLRELFAWEKFESDKPTKQLRLRARSLDTACLSLSILWSWSRQENYLRNAHIAAERTLLWAWEAIRKHSLTKKKKIMEGYFRLFKTYLGLSSEYFAKVNAHFYKINSLARYCDESTLLRERIFEELGRIASIGIAHLSYGYAIGDKLGGEKSASVISQSLQAFLDTHPATGSPCYDDHCIDISLAIILLFHTDRVEAAKKWLNELSSRLTFAYRIGRWFPIGTDNFDDLVALETDRDNVDFDNLKSVSWLIPTLAQWMAALEADEAYTHLVTTTETDLKSTCLQLWYPDESTDALRYLGPAHFHSGITEAPITLPSTAKEMREEMKRIGTESPVIEQLTTAEKAGLAFLDLIGCRHFRIPVDPRYWQQLSLSDSEAPSHDMPVKIRRKRSSPKKKQ